MAGKSFAISRALVRSVVIDLSIMTTVGLLLAFVGPFGSFGAPFAVRLVYWLVLCWAGYACYRPIAAVVNRLGPLLALPEPPLWIAGCLIATVPMSALVWSVGRIGKPFVAPSPQAALTLYGYVLVIGGGVTALFYALRQRAQPAQHVPAAAPPTGQADAPIAPRPRFLERIAPTAAGELLALEMEDHYLRVHTAHGSQLILLRMRDAVAELDGIDGAQVHRSWWVARHAVRKVRRDGRTVRLVLGDELEAPVARDAAAALKAAGWW